MAAPILLCDTTGMSNDRWLECRMHGPKGDIPYTIGGSDVAAIFGVSPWTTPLELWMIKKGRMKQNTVSPFVGWHRVFSLIFVFVHFLKHFIELLLLCLVLRGNQVIAFGRNVVAAALSQLIE